MILKSSSFANTLIFALSLIILFIQFKFDFLSFRWDQKSLLQILHQIRKLCCPGIQENTFKNHSKGILHGIWITSEEIEPKSGISPRIWHLVSRRIIKGVSHASYHRTRLSSSKDLSWQGYWPQRSPNDLIRQIDWGYRVRRSCLHMKTAA